mmetsp:Transcript_117395/g.226356  ORF Transcript_117395/g.226356 Transcript_117395/m.226356 type:complete len:757 (-) Transcript_117395:104-2374(-)
MPRRRAPSVSSSSRSDLSYDSRSSSPVSSHGSVVSTARSSTAPPSVDSAELETEVERGRAELDFKQRHIREQEKRQAALESRYGAKLTEREVENEQRRAELARKKEEEARRREEDFVEVARRREANIAAREKEMRARKMQEAEDQRKQSATKLQAMYRGKLARRELDGMKTRKKIHDANARKARERKMRQVRLQKERLQLQEEEKKKVEEEMRQLWFAELQLKKRHDAIRRIQGRVKGMLARRRVRELREVRAREVEIRSAAYREKQTREARDRHLRKVEIERQRLEAERQYQQKLDIALQRGESFKLAERSAIRIQAAFRGKSARGGVALYREKLRAEEQKRLYERNRAEVSRRLEMHQQKERERRQEEDRAALTIQTRYRGIAARQQVSQTKAQRLAEQRQRELDRQKQALRRHLAEQERLRAEQECLREEASAQEAAAVKIQARARSKLAHKEVNAKRLDRQARLERLELERLERERSEEAALKARQDGAATTLQAGFRGKAARQRTADLREERRRRLEYEERQAQQHKRQKHEEQEKPQLQELDWLRHLRSPSKQRIGGCGPIGGYQASITRSRSNPSGSITGGGLMRAELAGGLEASGHLPASIAVKGPQTAYASATRRSAAGSTSALSRSGPSGVVPSGARAGRAGLLPEADRTMQTNFKDGSTPRNEVVDGGAVRSRPRGGPASLVPAADVALRVKLEAMGKRFRVEALQRAQKLDAPASMLGEALARAQKLDAPTSMLGDQRLRMHRM